MGHLQRIYIVGIEELFLKKNDFIYAVTPTQFHRGAKIHTNTRGISWYKKKDKQTRIGDLIVEKNPATVIVHSWCSLANEDRL